MTEVLVTKFASDGRQPYRYRATLVERRPGWVVVEADWPLHEVNVGPVSFKPGDRLVEFFSTSDYYNAFLIRRDGDEFAGWYCNVTMPTTVTDAEIHWHDLYLDIIVDPSGEIHVEDEDELEESRLSQTDPDLYRTIIEAKDRLISMIDRREYPFSTVD